LDIFMLFFSQFLNILSKTFFGLIFFSHINSKFSMSFENASKLLSFCFISYYFTVYNIDSFIKRFGTKLCIAFGIFLNCIAVNLLNPISILPQ
jgi:fucose permease